MCKVIGAINESQKESLLIFGTFIGAFSIEYKDFGKREEYLIITKNGKLFAIEVKGNSMDGGWANFSGRGYV